MSCLGSYWLSICSSNCILWVIIFLIHFSIIKWNAVLGIIYLAVISSSSRHLSYCLFTLYADSKCSIYMMKYVSFIAPNLKTNTFRKFAFYFLLLFIHSALITHTLMWKVTVQYKKLKNSTYLARINLDDCNEWINATQQQWELRTMHHQGRQRWVLDLSRSLLTWPDGWRQCKLDSCVYSRNFLFKI